MIAARPLRIARRLAALASVLLAGCYTYAYAPEQPAPGTSLSLELTDAGRVRLAENVGPEVRRVEGRLVSLSDSAMVLQVAKSWTLQGAMTRWSGELVTFPTGSVRYARERQFSAPRTVVLLGSVTAGFVAFAATRGLIGLGAGAGDNGSSGGNTN